MKYAYPDKLWVRPSDDKPGIWVLKDDFRVLADGLLINTVPGGFRTDFASIPWVFRRILPKAGRKYGKPAVNHDHRYVTGDIPRKAADKEFHEAMLSEGVNKVIAKAMYMAVKWGAGRAWNKHRKADVVMDRDKSEFTKQTDKFNREK